MFETIQRDPRRSGPIGTRLAGTKGHEAHAHSPQRSTSVHLGRSISGIEQADAVAYQACQPRSHLPSTGRLPAPPTGLGSRAVLSRDEDPFMGPSSASHQWRPKGRSNSTDDTMPDYDADEAGHSRTTTEMSGISWPRRDFERHMNEAAIDEIVQALSPEKKSQLVKALSPKRSSSSGLQPPTNTPKTAETSKQPSPVLKGSNNIPETLAGGLDRLISRSRSLSDESSVSPSSDDRPSRNAGSGRSGSRISDRLMVTRSQGSKGPTRAQKIEDRHASDRERSDSVSSKRRKISLSSSTNTKASPKITLRASPSSASSDRENQQLTEDEHGQSGVAITIE
jgi:hypothetical protein